MQQAVPVTDNTDFSNAKVLKIFSMPEAYGAHTDN